MKAVLAEVEKTYPKEACGMIFGLSAEKDTLSRLRPCRNVQDDCHSLNPEEFPRTSKTAYFMDPADLLLAQKEARERKETLRIIYHSHIDAPAAFSEEDVRKAAPQGEALYPGVYYLVVSVQSGKSAGVLAFLWDEKNRVFKPQGVHLF